MSLKLVYRDREAIVSEETEAVIGSEADATVRIARPGISRRHVVIRFDDGRWLVEDASSRNGTYHQGTRIQTLEVVEALSIRLGHPTEGELIRLEPGPDGAAAAAARTEPTKEAPRQRAPTPPGAMNAKTEAELRQLIAVLSDTVRALRGLAWSVWAMIAVTAILVVLTLFVAIVGV